MTTRIEQQVQGRNTSNRFSVWQRLLWKEWRESWVMLAVGVPLPLLLAYWTRSKKAWEDLNEVAFIGLAFISILVTLWAVHRVASRQPGKQGSRGVLPLAGVTSWVDTYLLALPTPLIIGLALGCIVAADAGQKRFPVSLIFIEMFFLLVNYLLSTWLARMVSPIFGFVVGVVWLFTAFDAVMMQDHFELCLVAIIATLLASIPWEILAAKHRYLYGRVAATGVMVVVLQIATIGKIDLRELDFNLRPDFSIPANFSFSWYLSDATGLSLQCGGSKRALSDPHPLPSGWIRLSDARSGKTVGQHYFGDQIQPIGFIGRDTGVLFQYVDRNASRVLVWNARQDSVREVVQLPLKDLLTSVAFIDGVVSGNGRFTLIAVYRRSYQYYDEYGLSGADIWLIDMSRGKAVLVLPNTGYPLSLNEHEVSWSENRVLISGFDAMATIDLQAMHGRYVRTPVPDGRPQ